jgi:hypothetical protein
MNTRQRIVKLESVTPGQVVADNRDFVQTITLDGVLYKIDGVEVDAAKWAREMKVYDWSHEDNKIQVSIMGWDAIQEDKDGAA